jgi:hypothetical protein
MMGFDKTGVVLLTLAALAAGAALSADDVIPEPANVPGRMRSLSVPSASPAASASRMDAFLPFADAPRMRSLSVPSPALGAPASGASDVSVLQIGSGMAGRQSLTLRGSSGRFTQRQEGGGNTQILEAESTSAGVVSQRQSGSGNYQSMSIGVTDRRANVAPGISIQQ